MKLNKKKQIQLSRTGGLSGVARCYTVILLLSLLITKPLMASEERWSFNFNNTSLEDALNRIARTSGREINVKRYVTVNTINKHFNNETIDKILLNLLKGYNHLMIISNIQEKEKIKIIITSVSDSYKKNSPVVPAMAHLQNNKNQGTAPANGDITKRSLKKIFFQNESSPPMATTQFGQQSVGIANPHPMRIKRNVISLQELKLSSLAGEITQQTPEEPPTAFVQLSPTEIPTKWKHLEAPPSPPGLKY